MSAVAMKDSGVEWLGGIPSHWDVKPLKTVIRKVMNGAWGAEVNDLQDSLLPCIVLRGTDFPDAALGSLTNAPVRYIDKRDAAKKTLQQGDIVVEISGGSETQATGRALLITDILMSSANFALLCTNFTKALRLSANAVTPRFFSIYWFCLYVHGRPFLYEKRTTGIRNFQYKDFVANEPILLPPIPEQRAIASYLDTETAKIDAFINKTEALNSLLREKRVALISRAVTKGLDAGVEMKESGVEWLGDIPCHWDVKRLKFIGESTTGLSYSPAEVTDEGGGVLVLRAANIQGGNLVFDDAVFVDKAISEKLTTRDGDILICSNSGSRALIGKNARITGDAIGVSFGSFMTVFRSKYNDYLSCVFNSNLFEHHSGVFMTSTINQLTKTTLGNIQVGLPPIREQRAIASYLDRETARIDALINKNDELIALLREKRSALISAAVTGKISVPSLPSMVK